MNLGSSITARSPNTNDMKENVGASVGLGASTLKSKQNMNVTIEDGSGVGSGGSLNASGIAAMDEDSYSGELKTPTPMQ